MIFPMKTPHRKALASQELSPILQSFARKHAALFWDTSTPEQLSFEALLEGVLKYGEWSDVAELLPMVKKEQISASYQQIRRKRRSNLSPKECAFFDLLFEKYAHRNS